MQGRKNYTEKLFVSFQLSDRTPEDNLYRRLRETLDLGFLYKDTKELYGRTGNPSIDPVVFFKLLITGWFVQNSNVVKWLGSNTNNWKSIVLTKTEHEKFTAAWQKAIPYKNSSSPINTATVSVEGLKKAARDIYKDYPDILKALGL